MASGHVNRINRPNTWLHRPTLRREVLTCQPGAVHTWHLADISSGSLHVGYQGQSGHSGDNDLPIKLEVCSPRLW